MCASRNEGLVVRGDATEWMLITEKVGERVVEPAELYFACRPARYLVFTGEREMYFFCIHSLARRSAVCLPVVISSRCGEKKKRKRKIQQQHQRTTMRDRKDRRIGHEPSFSMGRVIVVATLPTETHFANDRARDAQIGPLSFARAQMSVDYCSVLRIRVHVQWERERKMNATLVGIPSMIGCLEARGTNLNRSLCFPLFRLFTEKKI